MINKGLVTLEHYFDVPTAHMARGFLETNGIPCFIFDDQHVQAAWFLGHAVGIRLMVHSEDLESAQRLLNELKESTKNESHLSTYAQSASIKDKFFSILLSFLAGVPFLAGVRNRKRQ